MRRLAASLAAGAVMLLRSSFCVALPPPEAFSQRPAFESPQISPDGRHLAAIQSIGNEPGAVIYDVGPNKGAPAVFLLKDWITIGAR
jgi:hypothetical protein